MTQAIGSMDRRQASLRPGPAAQAVPTPPDDKKKHQDSGRVVEFMHAVDFSRGN